MFQGIKSAKMYPKNLPNVKIVLIRLVRTEVTDYGASWTVVAKKLGHAPEFVAFVDIFGVEAAQRIFR